MNALFSGIRGAQTPPPLGGLYFGAILSQTYKDMTLYPHLYQNVYGNLLQKNFSIQEWLLYKRP